MEVKKDTFRNETMENFEDLECVSLTVSYHVYLIRTSKVWSMLDHGSVGQFQNKECYFMFTYTFLASKNLCFYHFHFFY